MITLCAARMLVSAVEPVRDIPDPAASVVEADPMPRGLARLLPAVMRRLQTFRSAGAARREARRIEALATAVATARAADAAPAPAPTPRLLRASPCRPARVTLGTGASVSPV